MSRLGDRTESRRARRALALTSATLVLANSTWFSATAVIAQLDAEWHLSGTGAAWLTISVQLGFVAGALAASVVNLSDVVPLRAVIFAGSVGAAAVNAPLAQADSVREALPLRFLTGFFLAAVYPPAMKLVSTWFRERRGTALGVLNGASVIGSASPHLVNGLGGLDWHLVVYATSAMSLLGGLIALAGISEGPFVFPRGRFDPRQARRVFRNRHVRLACFGYFGHMWELYGMWTWFVVFFAHALDPGGEGALAAAAYATFVVMSAGGLGCWLGGVLGDRRGRPESAAVMMLVSGICALSIGVLLDAPTWVLLLVGCVWGFTVIADSAQFSAMVTEFAEQAYVGTALALQTAIGFGLTTTTIWLIPALAAAGTWTWAFAALAPGPALGVVAMIQLRRFRARLAVDGASATAGAPH